MPLPLAGHKMVTTPDEKKVIVAGGENGNDNKDSNLLIKYSGLGGNWQVMYEKMNALSDARRDFVAFVVPNDLTFCEYCKEADCLI